MNQDWMSFIKQSGGVFDDNGDTRFQGDTKSNCQKMNLSHLGIIRVSGEDKQTFLQGQLTNDARNIDAGTSQLSSFCTAKGRMLASFRILQRDDAWFLILPLSRLEPVLKRLKMFVLRAKVALEDVSDDFILIGLRGDCIQEYAQVSLPQTRDEVIHHDKLSFVRVEDLSSRFMVLGQHDAVHALWQKLDGAVAVSTSQWRLDDIRAGIPSVYDETAEAFIPQMTNLQLLNGVSFTKGCYTGQEVVARMQYLGKLKRRMYPVSFETDKVVKPGDDIYSSASHSGQGAGKIVDVVNTGENQYEALAVLEINSIEEGQLQLHDDKGAPIRINPLPYDFVADEK